MRTTRKKQIFRGMKIRTIKIAKFYSSEIKWVLQYAIIIIKWYFVLDLEKFILNHHVVFCFKRVNLSEFQSLQYKFHLNLGVF